ncbi:MAG: C13 family peptidase [Draconibacterium sp.]
MKLLNYLPLLLVIGFYSCNMWEEESLPTIRVGVMLPYSGDYASDWDDGLDWAVENINLAGGIAGCKLELVKKDLNGADVESISKEFIEDESIKAVIGPLTSTAVYEAAPLFISANKVLIAPVATAANISKAFSAYDYFWRLAEPDISQTKTLILLAQKGGARKIALLTEETQYGASFEDWFGFFATELGMEVGGIEVVNPGDLPATKAAWNSLMKEQPDAVVSAINLPSQNIELVKAYRENGQQTRLLMSDAAAFQTIIGELGTYAENLEGTTMSSYPNSGFDISYHVRYNKYPNAFISHMYDAVMLLGLSLEASGGEGGQALSDAMKTVVSGREGNYSWQRDELRGALNAIKNGIYPDISGASGSLDYDELYYTDVTSSTYGHWRVDAGQFVITDFYTSDGEGRISSTSAAYRIISKQKQEFSTTGSWPVLQEKKGLQAFLMATSQGWTNYRHQADVLQAYQLLKAEGLNDDNIILILADDLAQSTSNPVPGTVRNTLDGENLYHNVEIDYKLEDLSSQNIFDILNGNVTEETPVVLKSGLSDNVLLFTSGHGVPDGMVFDGQNHETLNAEYWSILFNSMHNNQRFRQVFWSLEACYSGNIGEGINTPGVMLMTGANPYETSKAYLYDSEIKNWLADKFAYSVNNAIKEMPILTFYQLYERCYSYVNGSHVSFYNYENFGNIHDLSLIDFVKP